MTASANFTRTWPVGRYTCTLTLPADASGAVAVNVEWAPCVPQRLTATELEAYRRGRDDALQAWAAATGQHVALVDL